MEFKRRFEDEDGVISIWSYDLDITSNGPILIENIYPKDYPTKDVNEDQSHLPLTKRRYINPNNGKEVGYTRAKNLGLI